MAVAALLATPSTVNASLYASGGLTSTLAEVGQFPTFFGRGSRLGAHAGVLRGERAPTVVVRRGRDRFVERGPAARG